MQVKYVLVLIDDEIIMVTRGAQYKFEDLKDKPEIQAIFKSIESTGNILFPVYKEELGNNKILIGAQAVKGSNSIYVDFRTFNMKIK